MKPSVPSIPSPRAIDEVLQASSTLATLQQRLGLSQQRLALAKSVVPPSLAQWLRAGPLDDTGWTILTPNAAVAAKLRQCLPRIEDVLREHGYTTPAIRIHTQ